MAETKQRGLDHTLMALADPTRRAILQRLTRGDARVTELAKPFSMSLNSVSKHIRVLERARLVRRQRVGREHVLSFNRKPLDGGLDRGAAGVLERPARCAGARAE
jgi:DNA-binding transcriptional ArsR family regulator